MQRGDREETVYILSRFSRVWLFETPWTVAHQAPLSVGFPRQGYWSGLPLPSPGESSHPRDRTHVFCVSCLGRCILYHCATWEAPEETGMRTNRKLRALVCIHPVGSSSLKTNWYRILKTPAFVVQPLARWSLSPAFPGLPSPRCSQQCIQMAGLPVRRYPGPCPPDDL